MRIFSFPPRAGCTGPGQYLLALQVCPRDWDGEQFSAPGDTNHV